MRRSAIPYTQAVEWIVLNDDTDWLRDPNGVPSVTGCLIADIYGRTTDEVTADLRRALLREEKREQLSGMLSLAKGNLG